MSILVVGGAGYIGSHAVYTLIEKKERVVVVDSLATGHAEAVHPEAAFYKGDIRDRHFLKQVFENEDIEAVMHFAASPIPSQSNRVFSSFNANMIGMETLLDVMKEYDVGRIVFASSAAVYGSPDLPVTEETEPEPVHPHGKVKWMMEKMLMEAETAYGLKYVILRSFNAFGAHPSAIIGEDRRSETHLISKVLRTALGHLPFVHIDQPENGTGVRDYVHVQDLAEAHVLAISHLRKGKDSRIYNLSYGESYSAEQIILAAQYVTGIPLIAASLTETDIDSQETLTASSSRARKELGWTPKHNSLIAIIRDAWNWHSANPNGYASEKVRQG
ncbi:UDP-glucose 4-epimerase GalE [Bacillus haynesii]|uniref:UDP-glucose 4-epimerase GalE n=1 Tax=Bacillus haynesii TaxID=1925021 RepID=UPI0003EDA2B3|nr:UDP-glucose 4-epimerase GalE [Bacillus haynesii]EWH20775.1 UDP-glucose 4-epimerase [Bacillus haynesii]